MDALVVFLLLLFTTSVNNAMHARGWQGKCVPIEEDTSTFGQQEHMSPCCVSSRSRETCLALSRETFIFLAAQEACLPIVQIGR